MSVETNAFTTRLSMSAHLHKHSCRQSIASPDVFAEMISGPFRQLTECARQRVYMEQDYPRELSQRHVALMHKETDMLSKRTTVIEPPDLLATKIHLLHAGIVHFCMSLSSPSQFSPPFWGWGLLHSLSLSCIPEPQVLLQLCQELHSLQPPFVAPES